MARQGLSEAEVWDDSVLLDSWNAALEEYNKYHSLAAKGEKVKLEPKEVNDVPNGDTSAHSTQSNAADAFTAPADTEPASVGVPPRIGPAAIPAMPSISQTLAGSVQDEGVKNIMMSWYYAGYYTGLYEGKQQGYAITKAESQQNG